MVYDQEGWPNAHLLVEAERAARTLTGRRSSRPFTIWQLLAQAKEFAAMDQAMEEEEEASLTRNCKPHTSNKHPRRGTDGPGEDGPDSNSVAQQLRVRVPTQRM